MNEETLRAILRDIAEEAVPVNLADKALRGGRRRIVLIGASAVAALAFVLGAAPLALASIGSGNRQAPAVPATSIPTHSLGTPGHSEPASSRPTPGHSEQVPDPGQSPLPTPGQSDLPQSPVPTPGHSEQVPDPGQSPMPTTGISEKAS